VGGTGVHLEFVLDCLECSVEQCQASPSSHIHTHTTWCTKPDLPCHSQTVSLCFRWCKTGWRDWEWGRQTLHTWNKQL